MNQNLSLFLILCLVSSLPITAAAAPQTPSEGPLWSVITELQTLVANLQTSTSTAIAELWGNATAQQADIQDEVTDRQAADDLLQDQINDIEPGSSVHFGDRNETLAFNTVYYAETDGFVCGYASRALGVYDVQLAGSTGPDPASLTKQIHVGANTAGITMPVKKGEYWKVWASGVGLSSKLSWIPLIP